MVDCGNKINICPGGTREENHESLFISAGAVLFFMRGLFIYVFIWGEDEWMGVI